MAVDRIYGDAGGRVRLGFKVPACLDVSPDAVLHGEQGRQMIGMVDQIDPAAELTVDPGLVGHQPHAAAAKHGSGQIQTVQPAKNLLFHFISTL